MKRFVVLVRENCGGESQWVRDSVHDDRESAADLVAELRAGGTPARVVEVSESE